MKRLFAAFVFIVLVVTPVFSFMPSIHGSWFEEVIDTMRVIWTFWPDGTGEITLLTTEPGAVEKWKRDEPTPFAYAMDEKKLTMTLTTEAGAVVIFAAYYITPDHMIIVEEDGNVIFLSR
jgi:hypothetical protein